MQERAVKTREAILQAAAELIDEYGFSEASVNKIIKRAGVTPGACISTSSPRKPLPMQS